jgi:serine/threonine protein kinase
MRRGIVAMSSAIPNLFERLPLEQLEAAVAVRRWFQEALNAEEIPELKGRMGAISEPARSAVVRECLRLEIAHHRGRVLDRVRTAYSGLLSTMEFEGVLATMSDPARSGNGSPAASWPPDKDLAGTMFGDFELVRELGRGGMGVVYEARQLSAAKRPVALKMIQPEHLSSPKVQARFDHETQCLARVDHPGIVRLLDAGRLDGCPFYAMELVDGESLEQRLKRGKLGWQESARLVRDVALAVGHYHANVGAPHRDLKPANILLPKNGQPKVVDFGLAGPLEGGARLSRSGELVGTPAYMAPEQAKPGDQPVGPLADVHALGAILYECVSGRPPFEAASVYEVLMQIALQDPPPLQHVCPEVPSDLAVICHQCLAKEANKRYQTALALAEDLDNLLSNRPIIARAVGQLERIQLWCRRNKGLANLAAALIVILIVGFASVTYLYLKELAEFQRAETQRQRANDFARLSLETLEGVTDRIVNNRNLEEAGLHELRQELLEGVVRLNEQMIARTGEDPDTQSARGHAYNTLAVIRNANDQHGAALEAALQAETIYDGLRAAGANEPAISLGLATARNHKAAIIAPQGKYQEALESLQAAGPLFQELVQEFQDNTGYRYHLALCQNNQGLCLRYLGKLKLSEAAFRMSLDNLQLLVDKYPSDARHGQFREQHLRFLSNFGDSLMVLGNLKDAEAPIRDSTRLAEKLVKDRPHVPSHRDALAGCLVNLAAWHEGQKSKGDYGAASDVYRQAREVYETLKRQFPQAREYRWGVALTSQGLASVETELDRLDAAEKNLLQARDTYKQLVVDFPETVELVKEYGALHANLAKLLARQRKLPDAEDAARKGVSLLEELIAKQPRTAEYRTILAKGFTQWGDVLVEQGHFADAADVYRRAVPAVSQLGADSAENRSLLGQCCVDQALAFLRLSERDASSKDQHAAEAVKLLRQAKETGFFKDAAHAKDLIQRNELAPLRQRADFKELETGILGNGSAQPR